MGWLYIFLQTIKEETLQSILTAIDEYFWREIDYDLDNMWFQQDRASSHTKQCNRAFARDSNTRNFEIESGQLACKILPL